MTKSTHACDEREFIKKLFDKYTPIVEAGLEQNAIPAAVIKAYADVFLDLVKRKDPLSEQIVEVAFGYMDSPH